MRKNSSSDTASVVALSVLFSARDPSLSALVAPGEEELVRKILRDRASSGWCGFALKHPWATRAVMRGERFLLGGIFAHYLARKRRIEIEVRKEMKRGIRQVVVLGAGYDTMAARYSVEFPECRFFELDHPATQPSKRAAVEGPANLQFVAIDLGVSLPAKVLADCAAFDAAQSALVVAEGLTMYLPEDRVAAMLRSSAEVAGLEGRVIFTFMERQGRGGLSFRGQSPLIGWWLRLRGEPFLWGARREELGTFLRDCGLTLDAVLDHRDLRAGVLIPAQVGHLPLAEGECICLSHPSPL
jgi:methyltransferase (TIGR00027 family)